MEKKKVTFDDIAKYTGFSKTTISRYFNNPDSLKKKNQEKIKEALEKLHYQENKLAKVLANGQTEFIGVIVPNLSMHYYAETLSHILSTYEQFGYKFLVFESYDSREKELSYIKELLAYNIEGMIILSQDLTSLELASYDLPIVTIERESRYLHGVTTNNYAGAIMASEHLISLDCDIYIHINSRTATDNPDAKRTKGFMDTCIKHQVPYQIIERDLGATFDESHKIYEELFASFEKQYQGKKKGIFISNDTHANIFLNIVYRHYGKLPDDYNIVGFDDSSIAKEAILPLTTVHQNIDALAKNAMELLVNEINERKRSDYVKSKPIHRQIEPSLVVRYTTHKNVSD